MSPLAMLLWGIIFVAVTYWILFLISSAITATPVPASVVINEGDRVCVEYIEADGYYCGAVVFTEHDDIYTGR